MHALQVSDHGSRQVLPGDHHKVNIASVRLEIAGSQRTIEVKADKLVIQDGLNTREEFLENGVDFWIWLKISKLFRHFVYFIMPEIIY